MQECTRRELARQAAAWGGALSVLTVLNFPGIAAAFKGPGPGNPLAKMKNEKFLQRDDLQDALKSLYMTYDASSPYPHKFNDVIVKAQLRGLEFYMQKGLEKEYAAHYIETMKPLLQRIRQAVQQDGPEKGLAGMFEETSCAYQLFETIDVKPGERTFPCPYKNSLDLFNQWLGTFTIKWGDVCGKWCTPTWTGFAKEMGIAVSVHPGETCSVKLA